MNWIIKTMTITANTQYHTLSFALDSKDRPHISYYDDSNEELEYGFYNGIIWAFNTIDSIGDCGVFSSISVDSNNHPHIGYLVRVNSTDWELRYAYSDGNDWQIETIDVGSDEIWSVDLYVDSNDNPHIAYYDEPDRDVKYAYRTQDKWYIEDTCTNGTVKGPDKYAFVLDSNGNPHVSYLDYNNRSFKHAYRSKSNWHVTVVDSSGDVGMDHALAVDSIGYPHIAYLNGSMNYVKYAWWNGTQWQNDTVDFDTYVIRSIEIAVDIFDNPHISYYDYSDEDLKYAFIESIIDEEAPILVQDLTEGLPTTGDPFLIKINASDNVGVVEVDVICKIDHSYFNRSMAQDPDEFWIKSISLPMNAKEMSYSFVIMDEAGNTHFSERQNISVSDNDDPIAVISIDDLIGLKETTSLNGSASSDNIGISNYTWTLLNGNIVLYGPNPTFTFHDAGVYTIVLEVTDAEGNWDTDTLNVTVRDISPPIPNAGPDITINQSETVEFFFHQQSSDNVGIEDWTWTFKYNGTEQILFHSIIMSSLPLFKFEIPGIYSVTMNVTDEAGNWALDTLNITVLDSIAPNADAGSAQEIDAGTIYRFDGTGSGDNVVIVNYTWIFEYDGKTVTLFGPSPDFSFDIPGKYSVKLVVTDANGNSGEDEIVMIVKSYDPFIEDDGPGDDDREEREKVGGMPAWVWLIGVILFVGVIVVLVVFLRKKKGEEGEITGEDEMGRIGKYDGVVDDE